MSAPTGYLSSPTADTEKLRSVFQPIFDKIVRGQPGTGEGPGLPARTGELADRCGAGYRSNPRDEGWFRRIVGASLSCCSPIWALPTPTSRTSSATIWLSSRTGSTHRCRRRNDVWLNRFLDGQFVGGGWTEANNVTLANLATTVSAEGDHFVVTGSKFYATGSLYADWLDVIGRGDDGQLLTALVRRDDPGVVLVDDWSGFGQRTTASGSARYDRVTGASQAMFFRLRNASPTSRTSTRSRCCRC